MENIKKCPNCGEELIKDLVEYQEQVEDEFITLDKVKGYRCINCGYETVDETIMPKIKEKIKQILESEKIVINKKNNMKPLLISKVREIRQKKDVSQKEVGKALGFTEQRFGAVERNDNTPTIFLALQLADILQDDVNNLYSLTYIPEELYNKLINLDKNLKTIKELEVLRKEYELVLPQYEFIKQIVKDLKKLIKQGIVKKDQSIESYLEKFENELNNNNRLKESIEKEINKEINVEKNQEYLDKLMKKIRVQKENIKLIKENKNKIKKIKDYLVFLNDEEEKRKVKKENLFEKIKKLEKNCLLKQGYCLDYEDWLKVKEKFKKYF